MSTSWRVRRKSIDVPPPIAEQIPQDQEVQIVLLWGPSAADDAWKAAGRQRFESAYSPEDSIYEQLIDAPST